MKVQNRNSGIYFLLEKDDWNPGDGKGFINAVKKLGAQYRPVEKPVDSHWWRMDTKHKAAFLKLKELHIDRMIEAERSYREEGYKPIPTVNRRFARKRIV